jgi:glycosyltransferase involved in cell wall biosynthesis
LVKLLQQWQPDLVQTWMYHSDLFGGLAAWAARVPVCWGIRHSDLSWKGNKLSTLAVAYACAWLSRWLPRRAISCSARAVEIHRALGYGVRFAVVPNGLDVTAWALQSSYRASVRDALALPADAFVFAHAGRNDPQKDHATLARAFSRVHAAMPNVRLVLCGQELMKGSSYFDALPFSANARAAVLALGPREDLPRIWQAADAFVLSSLGEGFPNAVAEAMAAGLPCVVTDVGDAAEIVGDTGRVVPPSNADELTGAMLEMIQLEPEQLRQLRVAALERVQSKFTLQRMAGGFQQIWTDVITEDKKKCVG